MTTNEVSVKHVRKSVIAGSWYPGHRDELSKMLDGLRMQKMKILGELGH